MATKADGSPLPVEYDGVGRCGIRDLKRNQANDKEVMNKVNKYEQKRYASKFDLGYYEDAVPSKRAKPAKVNLLSPRKPSLNQVN